MECSSSVHKKKSSVPSLITISQCSVCKNQHKPNMWTNLAQPKCKHLTVTTFTAFFVYRTLCKQGANLSCPGAASDLSWHHSLHHESPPPCACWGPDEAKAWLLVFLTQSLRLDPEPVLNYFDISKVGGSKPLLILPLSYIILNCFACSCKETCWWGCCIFLSICTN